MENNIYIVTSLPRTGTTSLCKMAKICELNAKHVLSGIKFHVALDNNFKFFADTPFYSPEFLIGLLESLSNEEYNFKFIHSHREREKWEVSFNRLNEKFFYKRNIVNRITLMDNICYTKTIPSFNFEDHYNKIKEISKIYNIPMLDYNFKDGWEPFCNFLGCDIPNVELPHLNKFNK
jgi:hypothetical protein